MILEGNERGFGAELARHLLNPRDNDHVTVHGIDGFVADDLLGAFAEAEMISGATQCQKYLFSLSLNPPPDQKVTIEVFEDAIAVVEQKLGLARQPRAIVFHEKNGRRHAHCVWSRIDAGNMKAIKLSHYKRKLMDVSQELYPTHDWDMPGGFKDHDARDPSNFSRQEAGQAKRAKVDPTATKKMFRRCWDQSDSKSAFAAALWEEGYVLARGNRRGFVAVDADGKVWSLSRWCGVKPKELRARLGSEDRLWSVADAQSAFVELGRTESKQRSAKTDAEFERRRQGLVERQRQERAALLRTQETRRFRDLADRNAQLPRGLKAVWMRMTGQYQKVTDDIAAQADAQARADRVEQQTLIERHLTERRDLDLSQHQFDLMAELNAQFTQATRPDPRQRLVLPRDDIPYSRAQLINDPALILSHISHKQAQFERSDVLRELAKRLPDPMGLKAATDTAMASDNLVLLRGQEKVAYSTKDYLAAENTLQSAASALSARTSSGVRATSIQSAIQQQDAEMRQRFGGQLSDEQRIALHHILSSSDLSCVVGIAGSGKSTMLKTANAAWAQQGVKVHGAALAGKAAEGLQSASGIASRTLASIEASWENGYHPIAAGDVLVVDEAGMLGTRQLARVTAKLHSIGAKLVLVGDPDQLQPIEAGTPFRTLIETFGAKHLTEIHRQREDWQREASRNLAAGEIAKAVAQYEQFDAVSHRWSRETALAALVEDYMADVEFNDSDASRLAFAHRRKDVFALNQAIRAAMHSSSDDGLDVVLETETGPRAFANGDRLVFTRNDKALGVKNGMLGTVVQATGDEMTVALDGGDGKPRTVIFDPRRFSEFDHGFAITIHKSQGVTVDRSYVLASRTMDAPLTYVAMTRHRDDLKLYVNGEDRPKWVPAETKPHHARVNIHRDRHGPSR